MPARICLAASRDRVAGALQVSRTKLANISAIKNGIKVPGILRHWELDGIPEAAALEIARMDGAAQYRLLDWIIEKGRSYTINEVRMFRTIWLGCRHDCPDHGGLCPNAETIYRYHFRGGCWDCPGCCRSCLKRDTCPQSCCKPAKSLGIEPPPAKVPENPRAKDPRLDMVVETFCPPGPGSFGRRQALRKRNLLRALASTPEHTAPGKMRACRAVTASPSWPCAWAPPRITSMA